MRCVVNLFSDVNRFLGVPTSRYFCRCLLMRAAESRRVTDAPSQYSNEEAMLIESLRKQVCVDVGQTHVFWVGAITFLRELTIVEEGGGHRSSSGRA